MMTAAEAKERFDLLNSEDFKRKEAEAKLEVGKKDISELISKSVYMGYITFPKGHYLTDPALLRYLSSEEVGYKVSTLRDGIVKISWDESQKPVRPIYKNCPVVHTIKLYDKEGRFDEYKGHKEIIVDLSGSPFAPEDINKWVMDAIMNKLEPYI